jgi:hypothetical protein
MEIAQGHISLSAYTVDTAPAGKHLSQGVKMVLPPFLFIGRGIVQFYTIQRQIKRNGGSSLLFSSIRATTILTRLVFALMTTTKTKE